MYFLFGFTHLKVVALCASRLATYDETFACIFRLAPLLVAGHFQLTIDFYVVWLKHTYFQRLDQSFDFVFAEK